MTSTMTPTSTSTPTPATPPTMAEPGSGPRRPRHQLITGGTARGRLDLLAAERPDVVLDVHARRSGPYATARQLLAYLAPAAQAANPDLVERHKYVVLYAAPELQPLLGPGPMTLVDLTPREERTRFFSHEYIRTVSHGIVDFLLEHTAGRRSRGESPLTVGIVDLDRADPTDQALVAIALRRLDPTATRLVIATALDGVEPGSEVFGALDRHAERRTAPGTRPRSAGWRTPQELAVAYVASECTSADPAERVAYEALPVERRRQLHDARADALLAAGDPGAALGPVPYHLERGRDPGGRGRTALRDALEHCVEKGFSAATVELGRRGALVCDPERDAADVCHFTAKAASALVPLGRLDEAEEMYRSLLRLYARPKVHMTASYGIAMLHTRFYTPRDHPRAIELLNQARAFASTEADPTERACAEVYQDNGRALVEMHCGRLDVALDLVTEGMTRLDREVPLDRYVVHRTQLGHNRARLLVALGRLDEARQELDKLVAADPYYIDYRVDRANVAARLGDLAAALADYDWAIEYQPPFAEVHFNRALLREQAGDRSGAVADLERALDLEPGLRAAWVTLAGLRLDAGDLAGTRAAALGGLASVGVDPELLCLRAQAEELLGGPDRAAAILDAAIEADPTFGPAYGQRAALRYDADDLDGAIRDLSTALDLGGEAADLRVNRALAREAQGDLLGAEADLILALDDVDPEDRDAVEEHLARCRAKRAAGRDVRTPGRVDASGHLD